MAKQVRFNVRPPGRQASGGTVEIAGTAGWNGTTYQLPASGGVTGDRIADFGPYSLPAVDANSGLIACRAPITTSVAPGTAVQVLIGKGQLGSHAIPGTIIDTSVDLPDLLGSKLVRYWDASKSATVTITSGKVSAVADQIVGTSGTEMYQSTAGNRPLLAAGGINGLDALTGDGTGAFMKADYTGGVKELFLIFKLDTQAEQYAGIFVARESATATRVTASDVRVLVGRVLASNFVTGDSAGLNDASAVRVNGVAVDVTKFDSSLVGVDATGVTLLHITYASAATGAKHFAVLADAFGGTGQRHMKGLLGAVAICNAALTTAERDAAESFLATKWGPLGGTTGGGSSGGGTGGGGGGGTGSSLRPFGRPSNLYGDITMQDEFGGTSLDTSLWTPRQWYVPATGLDNIRLRDGMLEMRAQRDGSGEFFWSARSDANKRNNAEIVTDTKFYQTYGYFEIEMKCPDGAGPWPGFWLYERPGSDRPEIDIVEVYSHVDGAGVGWGTGGANAHPTNWIANATDGLASGPSAIIDRAKAYPLLNSNYAALPRLDTGFNVWGCHWDATYVEIYFNGTLLIRQPHNGGLARRMFVAIDYWLGGSSGSPSDWNAALLEDWNNALQVRRVTCWALADGSTRVERY